MGHTRSPLVTKRRFWYSSFTHIGHADGQSCIRRATRGSDTLCNLISDPVSPINHGAHGWVFSSRTPENKIMHKLTWPQDREEARRRCRRNAYENVFSNDVVHGDEQDIANDLAALQNEPGDPGCHAVRVREVAQRQEYNENG